MNKYFKTLTVLLVFVIALFIPVTASQGAMSDTVIARAEPQQTQTVEEANQTALEEIKTEVAQAATMASTRAIIESTKPTTKQVVKATNSLNIEQKDFSETIKIKVVPSVRDKVNDELKNLETEIEMLAKLIYREARGIKSTNQKAAVVWCVLNRIDNGNYGSSIKKVITRKHQFAWVPNTPVKDEFYELAKDVVTRWLLEKEGFTEVGRILPSDYLFFAGRNGKNHFRTGYRTRDYWDFSWDSPYEN